MPRTKEAFQHLRDISRQNILEKAAYVFVSKGLANTKINDLARAAGVSQGLLYRYFSDKDDVFIALLKRAINGVIHYAQTAVKRTGTSIDKLRWLTEEILQGMAEEPLYYQLFSQAMAVPGKMREALLQLETLVGMLRELIIKGQNAGEVIKRDPDQLVFLYISCLFGLAAGKSISLRWIDENFPTTEAVLQILKP